MTDMNKSLIARSPYTVYSGVAAEDLEEDSVVLKIICPELLPNTAFGTVAAGITENTFSLKTRDGDAIPTKNTTSNHLVATWEPKSNSRVPPRVRKGEPVEVFQSGDQDKFMWRPTGRGRTMRTTDRVHIEIAATDPMKPGQEKTDKNTYSVYADSETKRMGMKSSKVNGEAAAFSSEFDLANGTFHISDDSEDPGNRIFLDTGSKSGVPAFQVNLKTGLTLKMEGNDIYIKVPGKLMIDVKDRFVINSPLTIFNLKAVGYVFINTGSLVINASKDFIANVKNVIGLNALSTKVNGFLIALKFKTPNALKAPVSGQYEAPTYAKAEEGIVNSKTNTPDTSSEGVPYRAP